MATAIQSSGVGVSMDVPPTQNTAPVLEYRCLYTPDLRRKQKRWQDGRLKFHTFNKRVMVYDERANFVGDAHHQDDYEFGEGVELRLDRGGILVDVGECIGMKEQDLTELVDKRLKEKEQRAAAKTAAGSPLRPSVRNGSLHAPVLQSKSLNSILASNSQGIRALTSGISPFEARQQQGVDGSGGHENERPAKRQRRDDLVSTQKGYAQALTGATLSLSSQRPSHMPTPRYERMAPKQPVNSEPASSVLDGRSGRTLGHEQSAASQRVPPELSRPTPRKRVQRSPPHRSQYATNLTGVTLSLSRPESLPQNPISKGRDSGRLHHLKTRPEPQDSSNLEDSNPLMETVRQPRTNRSHQLNVKPLISSTSSNADQHQRSRAITSQRDPLQAANPSSPANGVVRIPPVSSLTIKARPPRQLMMLMQPRSSLSRAPNNSSHKSQAMAKRSLSDRAGSNGIVMSQATAHLDAFCARQEKRLDARLMRRKSPTLPQEREAQSPSPASHGGSSPQARYRSASRTEINEITSSTHAKSPSLLRTPPAQENEETRIAESQGQLQGDSAPDSPRIVKRATSPENITSEPTRSSEEPSSPPDNLGRNSLSPSNLTAIRGGLQRATRHFRDIIASAPHSFSQAHNVHSSSPDLHCHGMQNGAAKTQPTALGLDTYQKIPASQTPAMDTPRVQSSVSAGPESSPVFVSTGISDLIPPPTQINNMQSLEETKLRLVNPATRGRTLHTLTSFNPTDIPVPAPNPIGIGMPPPLAVQRREQAHPRRRDVVAAVGSTTSTTPVDVGPWSRESFDLFGTWRETKLKEQIPVSGNTDVSSLVTA